MIVQKLGSELLEAAPQRALAEHLGCLAILNSLELLIPAAQAISTLRAFAKV